MLRIIYGLNAYNNNVMENFDDDKLYMNYAKEIVNQGFFVWDNSVLIKDHVEVAYGLPWFLSIIISLFGENWLVIFIINALLSTLSCFFLYYFCRHFIDKNISLLAAFISVFYILYIKFVPTSGKEIGLVLLLLSSYILIFKSIYLKKYFISLLSFSIIYTYLIHFDERYISYYLLFIIIIFYAHRKKIRLGLKKIIIFSSVVAILMTPWLYRNYKIYDKLVLISKRTERINTTKNPIIDHYFYISPNQIDSIIQGTKIKTDNGYLISSMQRKAMEDGIIPHEFSKKEKYISTVINLWKPVDLSRGYDAKGYKYNGRWSLKHNISVGLTYGLLLVFSLLGIFKLYKINRLITITFVLTLFYHTFIHVFLMEWARNRYRIPIDFIIIICGTIGIKEFIKTIKFKLIQIYGK